MKAKVHPKQKWTNNMDAELRQRDRRRRLQKTSARQEGPERRSQTRQHQVLSNTCKKATVRKEPKQTQDRCSRSPQHNCKGATPTAGRHVWTKLKLNHRWCSSAHKESICCPHVELLLLVVALWLFYLLHEYLHVMKVTADSAVVGWIREAVVFVTCWPLFPSRASVWTLWRIINIWDSILMINWTGLRTLMLCTGSERVASTLWGGWSPTSAGPLWVCGWQIYPVCCCAGAADWTDWPKHQGRLGSEAGLWQRGQREGSCPGCRSSWTRSLIYLMMCRLAAGAQGDRLITVRWTTGDHSCL